MINEEFDVEVKKEREVEEDIKQISSQADDEENESSMSNEKKAVMEDSVLEENTVIKEEKDQESTIKKVINLGNYEENNEELVYRSKNERVKDYVIYGFLIFLVLIVGVLLYERLWYKR